MSHEQQKLIIQMQNVDTTCTATYSNDIIFEDNFTINI